MPRSKAKPAPAATVETKSVHIPASVHLQVKLLAAHRNEDIGDVAAKAISAGLPTLDKTPSLN